MTFYRRAAVLSSAIVFITIVLVNQQPVVQNQDNGEIIDGISRYIDDETTHMSDDEILVLARAVYVGSALAASLVGLARWAEGATKSTWDRTDRMAGVGHA